MNDYKQSITEAQYKWLTDNTKTLVSNVIKHCQIGYTELDAFREDLQQEALTQLFEHYVVNGHDAPYAYVAARTNLIGFVYVLMRGKADGHQWELSKQYETYNNLTEEHDDQDDPEKRAYRLPLTVYQRRPVEDSVIKHEDAPEEALMWADFEREIARIIAVLRDTQWHPQSILRSAKVLAESAKGSSNYCISTMIGQEWHTTTALIIHYRTLIKQFLEMTPIMQGMIRAEGELRLKWWHEITQEAINTGERFIVISPYGSFVVYGDKSKSKNKSTGEPLHYLRLQAGRRIKGRIVNRSVQIGKVGHVTIDQFAVGLERMASKLAQLEGRQALEGVAA